MLFISYQYSMREYGRLLLTMAGLAPVLCCELKSFLEYLLSQSILMSFSGEVYILCSKELRYGYYRPNWCFTAGFAALFISC